ncbi:MAG TPA: cytochrome P450 [Herpetosiphonaceae bacterium]|nr:cytochrome P450 [Herpetosiphonaceae bacterium]
MTVLINDDLLIAPELYDNPYPTYARMLREAPVYWNETTQCWYLFSYEHVALALRDPRFSANRLQPVYNRLPPPVQEQSRPLFESLGRWALLLDPPDHTRLRKVLSAAFAPRVTATMDIKIQSVLDELVAALPIDTPFDLIRDLANPLPIVVIAELLGADPGDRAALKAWSTDIARFFGAPALNKSVMDQAQHSILALQEYFRAILRQRRAAPKDDLMTALLQAEADGVVLDDEELLASCVMLLFGGHETTTNLIGNGVLALLNHPDQRAILTSNAGSIAYAVEEILRFDSPVQRLTRLVSAELVMGGQSIRAGQRVMLMIGAANHDPAHFAQPDRFTILRPNNRHLSFGFGPHFCLGSSLARQEGELTLNRLFYGPRRLQLAGSPQWQENLAFRSLAALPVLLSAS